MAIKDLLSTINEDVKDLVKMGFELTQTQGEYVPHYDDPGLTFERGLNKKAKLIETCVLYADIRNSTELSRTKSREVMARLYTAFVKSLIYIADYHGGSVRNIIGDRVMIVFPHNNCFTNAVDAAVSINTISSYIIDKHFRGFDFKVGIGIDYGEMKVIKAGIPKQDKERTTYKNLVWIGNAANIASKLTDIANKEITETFYRVRRHPINPYKFGLAYLPLFDNRPKRADEPLHLSTIETVDLSPEQFADTIRMLENGNIFTVNGEMLSFEKKDIKSKTEPILMSQQVWQEFKKANPTRGSVLNNNWTTQNAKVKEYGGTIIGGDLHWKAMEEI